VYSADTTPIIIDNQDVDAGRGISFFSRDWWNH